MNLKEIKVGVEYMGGIGGKKLKIIYVNFKQ